jgi:hypothetical protein
MNYMKHIKKVHQMAHLTFFINTNCKVGILKFGLL